MSFESDLEAVGLCKNDFIDIASNFELLFEQSGNVDRVYIDLPQIERFESFTECIIKDFLKHRGFKKIDYIQGICYKGKRKYKIGRLLNTLNEKKYLAQYEKDPSRISINDCYSKMVISRKPEDILYMSTNRRWSSCSNINYSHKGDNNQQLQKYIVEDGGVVVYGIHKDDLDIKHPYFRKWFQNDGYLTDNSRYYGLYHLSTAIYIDQYILDYLDKQLPYGNLKDKNKNESFYFDKLKAIMYNQVETFNSFNQHLGMELSILNELLLDEDDIVDYDVIYDNSLDILNDLDVIFKTLTFRRRIFLIIKLLKKYSSMNKIGYKLSIYSIRDLVNSRIMYHYVGTNIMEMKKAYGKKDTPWWVESEETRYKLIENIDLDLEILRAFQDEAS